MSQQLVARSRAIIIHEGKLLLVKHAADSTFYALPGGHIERNEDPRECMARELEEELGIRGSVGRLLYVNTFMDRDTHSVEFFFEIINASDYHGIDKAAGTHRKEIYEVRWVDNSEEVKILPSRIDKDRREKALISNTTRFIKG